MKAGKIRAGILLIAMFAIGAPPAIAQGCSMCYNNAAAADTNQRAALRKGIWALGTPAVLFMGAIAIVAYRSNRPE